MTDSEVATGEPRWRRVASGLYAAAIVSGLSLYIAMIVWHPLVTRDDFWSHIAIGRWIWESGTVPHETIGLWTAKQPHVYHSWLSQLTLFGLTNVSAPERMPEVVLAFTALMVIASFGIIWFVSHRCGGLSIWLAAASLLAVEASSGRFQVRPDLFTSLFQTLLMAFLVFWSRGSFEGPSRAHIAALSVVAVAFFSLWANFHGAVAFGLMLMAGTAGCDLLQDRFDRRSRFLALLALAAALGVCLNPYGLDYWRAYLSVRSEVFKHISEWTPIWSPNLPVQPGILVRTGLIAGLALAAWGMNPNRRWSHLLWVVAFAAFYAQARRNIWPCCLASLCVLAANAPAFSLANVPARWTRLLSKLGGEVALLRAGIRLGLALLIGYSCLNVGLRHQSWRPLGPADAERGIVRFIKVNRLEGRMYNDSEIASFLQYRLAGDPPLYIDNINAYPVEAVRNYLEIATCSERGRKLLDEQGVEIVVLSSDRSPKVESLAPLADHLDAHPEWCRVHASRSGMIWVRRNAKYESIWKRLEKVVHPVKFAVLEEYQRDREKETPPLIDDMDREYGRQPPPKWELFPRLPK